MNLLKRLTRPNRCTLPWTQEDVERHAAAISRFHALLERDGGFRSNRPGHVAAMREVGEATVSYDWHFFAASRALRGEQ